MESDHSWDDLRIAWQVAETGSLSRAGECLGLNHATVLRHVNRLEARLEQKLFIRSQRGYRVTDAGQLLLERLRPLAEEMRRLQGSLATLDASPAGTLRISTVSDFSVLLAPLLHEFRLSCPRVRLQIVATDERVSLAAGEAHVAIRLGPEPTEPDLIARALPAVHLRYYASPAYVVEWGRPTTPEDIDRHWWAMPTGEKARISGVRQILERLDPERIVFASNSFADIHAAIRSGMGIGPIGSLQVMSSGRGELEAVDFGQPIEPSPMWFVYHRDMRRSARVQALQAFMLRKLPELERQLL